MANLFITLWVSPENIIALLLDLMLMAGICLTFAAWKERWWKGLIPVYSTYFMYRHTWGKQWWMFLVQILLEISGSWGMRTVRKQFVGGVLDAAQRYLNTGRLQMEINAGQIVVCLVLSVLAGVFVFLLTRITYLKICRSLGVENLFLKIGTVLLPEVFLLVNYGVYRKRHA